MLVALRVHNGILAGRHVTEPIQRRSSMPKDKIEVSGPVDYEDRLEGGYNYIYDVVSCTVGPEKGELTWDRVVFPKFPIPAGSSPSDIGVMISRRNPVVNHVSTMRRVGDDVLLLLRERGVKVVIHHNPSEAMMCGD